MKKFWMVLGLAALTAAACGKKEPAPAPPPPAPAAAAPQAMPDTTKAAAPAEMAKPEKTVKPKMATSGKKSVGPYTLQVAAWETKESAQKLADFFNTRGFEARVEAADVKGGEWYRVRIGKFEKYAEASAVAEQIKEKYNSQIWLVKL